MELAIYLRLVNKEGKAVTAGIRRWVARDPQNNPLPRRYVGDLPRFYRPDIIRWTEEETKRHKNKANVDADQEKRVVTPPQDVRRFKTSLKNGTTPRGLLRSGATVNRYIYLLSAICALAIEEEIMTSNHCAKIVDEPEKARERYLTSHEETRLVQTMKNDLAFLRLPFEVSLHTGMRKNIELLKLKVEHLNFSSRPVFFPVHGGSVEIPSNWLKRRGQFCSKR